jgi:hypothetical protein
VSGSAKSKIFSCFMYGQEPQRELGRLVAALLVGVHLQLGAWAKHSSVIRRLPAATRRRFTSRSTDGVHERVVCDRQAERLAGRPPRSRRSSGDLVVSASGSAATSASLMRASGSC